jgi:hypothetical protein
MGAYIPMFIIKVIVSRALPIERRDDMSEKRRDIRNEFFAQERAKDLMVNICIAMWMPMARQSACTAGSW